MTFTYGKIPPFAAFIQTLTVSLMIRGFFKLDFSDVVI